MSTILVWFGVLLLAAGIAASCSTTPCQNSGYCNPSTDTCLCPLCFEGTSCETEKAGGPLPCPCFNGGTCKCYIYYTTSNTPAETYKCMCPAGIVGLRCESDYLTVPTVPPTTDPPCPLCQNGGVLSNGQCECTPYYIGNCCETFYNGNPCSSYPCNGGACSYAWLGTKYGYQCDCPNGITGDNCQGTGQSEEPCAVNPCLQGGSCVKISATEFECVCPCFLGGALCEQTISPLYSMDPCQNSPCLNGATCYCAGTTYKCKCRLGYSGSNCESGSCVTGTCDYGNCDGYGGCSCFLEISGTFCQFPSDHPCSTNPCENGGTCIVTSTTAYVCNCPCMVDGIDCEFGGQFLPKESPCALYSLCGSPQICACQRFSAVCI